MPISSTQVSGIIGGQQAMFGNAATYSQQISPFGSNKTPTYSNPMGGAGYGMAQEYNQGVNAMPGAFMGMAAYGAPAMAGAGMLMGGRMGGMMDPFTGGMRGAGRAVGWQGGAGLTANLGRVAGMGVRAVPRLMAGAALGAAPAFAIAKGIQHVGGQMAEGAQYHSQVSGFLQNAFRFSNPESRTGMGFSQAGMGSISSMMQKMGTDEMMTTPQELNQIMQRGTGMGVFRGVQDAREFKQRFRQMKDTLTEIASTFNTTLSEALPFFQSARQQGFWTPQDISRHAGQVRQVQANTGMSTAQAQAMTAVGSQMVRGIGGTGAQGSQMMAKAQMMTGSALYGGTVSSQQLADAGFGSGAQGAQNLGQMLGGMTARFSRSRVGRWALASMMNDEGTGLDPTKLAQFTSGGMSVGKMSALARKNVSGGRAYKFVENEETLRGQLAEQGPEAMLGIIKSLTGSRLYGGSSRDRLVTRKIIQRFTGGNRKQADMIAKMTRDLPRMLEIQAARSENSLDTQETQRERMMGDSWEGVKRKIGHWWEKNVDGPLKEAGVALSKQVGRTYQKWSDKLFGTGGRSVQLSHGAVRSMSQAAATGDMSALTSSFGSSRLREQIMGDSLTGARGANADTMDSLGFNPTDFGGGGLLRRMIYNGVGSARYSSSDVRQAQNIMRARSGGIGDGEAEAAGYGGVGELIAATRGDASQQIEKYLRSNSAMILRGKQDEGTDGDRSYAKEVLKRVRSGAAGKAAQEAVEGLDDRTATTRVMALQGGARGTYGAMVDKASVDALKGATAEQLEEQQEDAVDDLTKTLRGSLSDWMSGKSGTLPTPDDVQSLMKTPEGSRAMKLFAEAKALRRAKEGGDSGVTAEEIEKKKQEARDALGDAVRDGGLSKGSRAAALKLMEGGSQAEEQAGSIGENMIRQDLYARDKKFKRRMKRFSDRLGGEGRKRLEAAYSGSEGDKRLKQTISKLMRGEADSPEAQVQLMRDLAMESAKSPETAAKISSILQQEGVGNTEIGVIMKGAQDTAGDIKRFAVGEDGGSMKKMFGGSAKLLSRLGVNVGKGGLSAADLKGAIGGDAKAQDRLRTMLEGRLGEGRAEGILGAIKGGLTEDEISEHMSAAVAAGGLKTHSNKVAKEAGLEKGAVNMSGREGSRRFMGEQLRIQTELARRQLEATNQLVKAGGGKVNKYKGQEE